MAVSGEQGLKLEGTSQTATPPIMANIVGIMSTNVCNVDTVSY
jgi:hypothetical protein